MTYNEVLELARGQVGPCKACPVCNGKACGNDVPGPGCKAPGNTAQRNWEKWQEYFVNMDTICANRPADTSFRLFGWTFRAPIFIAPIGAMKLHYGDKYHDTAYNAIVVPAAVEAGVAAFTGDGVDATIMPGAVDAIAKCGGLGIPTIKPWDRDTVFGKLDLMNDKGFFAAAMDIDAAGLPFLKAQNANAGSKSVAELREITDYAKMPFFLKGIMTPTGAKKAIDAGAAGIVVSNHGGRVQGGVPSTAEVLPGIVEAVAGQIPVFVDGGIRSGVDVYRALALGADAVLMGRPVVPFLYAAGAEGLKVFLDKVIAELADTMAMCGTPTLADIGRDNVVKF